jgi:hypothetical protein
MDASRVGDLGLAYAGALRRCGRQRRHSCSAARDVCRYPRHSSGGGCSTADMDAPVTVPRCSTCF